LIKHSLVIAHVFTVCYLNGENDNDVSLFCLLVFRIKMYKMLSLKQGGREEVPVFV
jgi:hypothetical protein